MAAAVAASPAADKDAAAEVGAAVDVDRFRMHDKDVGSSRVQIAALTGRIRHLTEHAGRHPKDNHSRRGLIGAVNRRRRLLNYLKRTDPESHAKLLTDLELRK